MKMRWWTYCSCMLALIFAAAPALAEDPAPVEKSKEVSETKEATKAAAKAAAKEAAKDDGRVPGDERSADSRKLLEEVLMARLTRELSLNEEQSVLMVRHLAEFREKMADIRRERMELARNLRQALRDNQNDEAIGKLLEEVVAYEDKASAERRKFVDFEDFKLSTSQKARLYLFIVDFEGDMRRLLKQAQERRLGRGMKPGGLHEDPLAAETGEAGAPAPPEGQGDSIAVEEASPATPASP